MVITGAVKVRTYEVHLDFDPTKLAFVDLISTGTLFQLYQADMGGNIRGTDLGLVNSIVGQTPSGASGDGELATIRFRVIARSTKTELKVTDATLISVDQKSAKPKLEDAKGIGLGYGVLVYHDASGKEVRGLVLGDVDAKVDFNDFLILTQAFGTNAGTSKFDLRADLNGDNVINFADFLILANDFNKVAVDAPSALRSGKTTAAPGANAKASVGLSLNGAAKMGEAVSVMVQLTDANALSGWGITVGYDAQQYDFVGASAPDNNLLLSSGGSTPLFLVNANQAGLVSIANALTDGSVSGEGSLVVLTFQPKGVVEEGRFEIVNGVLFDNARLSNPVGLTGLDVRLVPSEFALMQNFPNPFNPETTISYDLAGDVDVRLEVYNVMGQLVQTLVNNHQNAGRYRIVWAGDDASGRQVASGIYFYRLQAGDFSHVRKLMLLK
jgi:hypothetical protein